MTRRRDDRSSNGRCDEETRAEWCRTWAPECHRGGPLLVRRALGFWERNISELELRVPLGGDDEDVCQVIVDEQENEVYVRVLVHYEANCVERARNRSFYDCPVRTWLEQPLGNRAVIDVDTDEELPLFTPRYLNNVLQPDHGYRPANRRRRRED